MYCGERTERSIPTYLFGFNAAGAILTGLRGVGSRETTYWTICDERGWEMNAFGPQKLMRDAGWNEDAIVDELLDIEIEIWLRISAESTSLHTEANNVAIPKS
jgi:hypothetical protein